MTPKSEMEQIFRSAVLDLAEDHAFARRFVNSGRLSQPCSLSGFALQSGSAPLTGRVCPDAVIADQNGQRSFLLDHLGGQFQLLIIGIKKFPPCPRCR